MQVKNLKPTQQLHLTPKPNTSHLVYVSKQSDRATLRPRVALAPASVLKKKKNQVYILVRLL